MIKPKVETDGNENERIPYDRLREALHAYYMC